MKGKNSLNANPQFLARMQTLLCPTDYQAYLRALDLPPLRYARANSLKAVSDRLLQAENGAYPFLPPNAKPGKKPLHAAGAYYVQEPAAAAVSRMILPFLPPHARVLDMCAAPGGKATAVGCERPDCELLANEVVFARAKILLQNVERLGISSCTVTCLPAHEIARIGAGLFDAVIADVPCSGEGMVRKTDFGTAELNDDGVAACAVRARKILDECDVCLKTGGVLLFSTCTFNRTENEEQIAYLFKRGYEPIEPQIRPARSRGGFDLPQAVRFFPQDGGGEGHFACLLKKTGTSANVPSRTRNASSHSDKRGKSVAETLARISSAAYPAERIVCVGEGCDFVPEGYSFAAFPALRRGIRLADFIGNRIAVHHHFATAANTQTLLCSPDYAPDAQQIADYLEGKEFMCETENGMRVVRVAGLALGLIKVSDGVAKNHYPKGLRFRID